MTLARSLIATATAMAASAFVAHPAGADPSDEVTQTNLVSDMPGVATTLDPNLKNPWGIAFAPDSPFWFSDNNSGLSTLYDGQGNIIPLVVTIPAAPGQPAGTPTGIVWNSTQGFQVPVPNSNPASTAASVFIFATEDGTIAAWSPTISVPNAETFVDNSGSGAVYKGLALATNSGGNFLFATNFRAGTVDIFDSTFKQVTSSGGFTDPHIPSDYAPFGIANIDGDLFVTYAKQDAAKHDDVAGEGHGFADVYSSDGVLLRRFAEHGTLNSPWGIVRAPYGFRQFAGDILIGNFGDGTIHAYPPSGGFFSETLRGPHHHPIVIDGLWGLSTGTALNSDADTIYFTAGPNDEADGLFGSLTPGAGHGGGHW
ncbi:MAG TPA: TIGR03118 family protein [Stellaceae bacterium]|nr:TIGR03118 family protein [Stellaceae bacterium]